MKYVVMKDAVIKDLVMTEEYGRLVKTAVLGATACASGLLLLKVVAWWMTGSVSLLASVIDSFVDITASLTNLLVVRYALQPPDQDHTFGHGKAESLAALAQSMFISGSALFLLLTGFQKLVNPQVIKTPIVGIVIICISLAVTFVLLAFQRWVIRQTQSQAIRADMLHYQSDILMNIAILFALGLSWYGFDRADGLFAIAIGFYILYSAWIIAYEAVQSLLDQALPNEERRVIMDTIQAWPGVVGAHDLRTRQSGHIKFIQLHLELADTLPLVDAHAIADGIERQLQKFFPDAEIIIHQDPCSVVPLEQKGFWQN